MIKDPVAHLKWSLSAPSKLTAAEFALDGMSGNKGRALLNNLCSLDGLGYLEVGLWRGSTFFSALKGNRLYAFGVDNWSEFGGPLAAFKSKLSEYVGVNSVQTFDADIFKMDLSVIDRPIDIYFYDGGHSEENHRQAVTQLAGVLAEHSIFIVDDYNWERVVKGTKLGLAQSGLRIAHEEILGGPGINRQEYHNGMYVAVLRKS